MFVLQNVLELGNQVITQFLGGANLSEFPVKYPTECRQLDDDGNGCKTFEVRKGRFSFRLMPPYSEERKQAASALARKNTKNLRRGIK